MTARLVVVGDALLDRDLRGSVDRVAPDAPVPVVDQPVSRPRPGGAGLAAALAARDGRPVVLVTALARDDASATLRQTLEASGVEVVDLGLEGRTPEKVRVWADGRALLRIDHGDRRRTRVGRPTDAALRAIERAAAVLVSDYGWGVAEALRDVVMSAARSAPVVWDPHVRGPEPPAGIRLATPNLAEALRVEPVEGEGLPAAAACALALVRRWRTAGVAVTMGPKGALLQEGEEALPVVVSARPARGGDPCGAGDRFAVTAAERLGDGGLPSEAVADAVASATAFVASGGAGAWAREPEAPPASDDAETLARRVRATGGTVVTTSGCFDLLHAGHVSSLQAARALGDCLIVCLNSDASVRRLKGPGRPLTAVEDRAAVLRSLGCVDAVVVFDGDTPEAVLERLRPHLFAKGGDYAIGELPEARLVRRWGGQAVILPYMDGRSTTHIMKEVLRRGSG